MLEMSYVQTVNSGELFVNEDIVVLCRNRHVGFRELQDSIFGHKREHVLCYTYIPSSSFKCKLRIIQILIDVVKTRGHNNPAVNGRLSIKGSNILSNLFN